MSKRENTPIGKRFAGVDRRRLRHALRATHEVRHYRRLDAVLLVAEGQSLEQAARHVGCDAASVRRWAVRYLRSRDAQSLADHPRSGRPRMAEDLDAQRLGAVLASDPRQYGYQATTWTAPLLAQHLRTHEHVQLGVRTLRRRLHEGRWRWKRPRYFYSERVEPVGPKKGGSPGG